MLTLSYLIARCAGSIWQASRWQRQVTSWAGAKPLGVGVGICALFRVTSGITGQGEWF